MPVTPESRVAQAGVDWVNVDPANLAIGGDVLRDACQQAEELD